MDLTNHFEYLNTIGKKEKEETNANVEGKKKCCELKENYQMNDDVIVCKECSNIITNISMNPEWRFYGTKDSKQGDPTRCGMPVNTLLPESSVGSTVSFSSNSASMHQIRKYQQWSGMPYKERSLYKVFLEIQTICSKNNIPLKIVNEAKSIYTIISETKISRGSNRSGIIAACVYFACKECSVPRSPKEIAKMFNITINIMTKGVKKCQEIIYMNKNNKSRLSTKESIKPSDFIDRFCNKLHISEEDSKLLLKICDIAIKHNIISENTPPSIASGCIYYFIKKKNLSITKKDISDICIISEVTINKCSKNIELNDHLFNEVFDGSISNCNDNPL
tara:strand:- start:2689 stop:3693 length:1005 start_codon:yes stop_codon:yes gene_type:complete